MVGDSGCIGVYTSLTNLPPDPAPIWFKEIRHVPQPSS